jgi:hypothetical protein
MSEESEQQEEYRAKLHELQSAVIQNMIALRGPEDGEYLARVIHEEGFEVDPQYLALITMAYLTGVTSLLCEKDIQLVEAETNLTECLLIATTACRRLDELRDIKGQILLTQLSELQI